MSLCQRSFDFIENICKTERQKIFNYPLKKKILQQLCVTLLAQLSCVQTTKFTLVLELVSEGVVGTLTAMSWVPLGVRGSDGSEFHISISLLPATDGREKRVESPAEKVPVHNN